MIWASIIGNELMGPFKVEDGVKIDLAGYTQFLEKNPMPWMKKKSAAFKKMMVFMQGNAPSHASKFTREWLTKESIKEDHLITRPSASSNLNPIENYWSLLKRELYVGGKQYSSKESLCNEMVAITKRLRSDVVQNLTATITSRLVKIIERRKADILTCKYVLYL